MTAATFLHRALAIAMVALPLSACGGFGYSGPKGKCVLRHYITYRPHDEALAGCDPETFEVLSASYARDADQVWFKANPIPEADPSSFDVIWDRVGTWPYARDAHHVYFQQHRVCGADPASFELLDFPYARDASKAFCGIVPIPVSDPKRFRVLRSTTRAMGGLLPESKLTPEGKACLRDVDPHYSAVIADEGWARDDRNYFRGCWPMPGIDYASFEILSTYYSKDRRAVYYAESELPGADPSTFEVLRPERCGYAKDAHAVYQLRRVVPGADPASFEVAGPWRLVGPRTCKPRDAIREYSGPRRPSPPAQD